ncbi:MAG: hypothetical protein ORN21_06780, partial [Methylophilaceae bacterium]|nr:hypothetical protein [Methylophilaceae bacterium]
IPYELGLAVTELTTQETIRRAQAIVNNEGIPLDKQSQSFRVQQLLAELPNGEWIRSTPAMREYLNTLAAFEFKASANAPQTAVVNQIEKARIFLTETLEASLTRANFDKTIATYYDSDVTDARFTTGLTTEQIKVLELGPSGHQATKQQILTNKNTYFEALPERERLSAKVRYFLSVEDALQRVRAGSSIRDSWTQAIKQLPAEEESTNILRALQKVGTKSLTAAIDRVVTSPAFNASELERAGYLESGGVAGLSARESEHFEFIRGEQRIQGSVASAVRGTLLKDQLLGLKNQLQEVVSRQGNLLGMTIEYRKAASDFALDPSRSPILMEALKKESA